MFRSLLACLVACSLVSGATAAQDRKPPYWASIASGEARMRTGPALTYPAIWLYKRRDLPIRVIATHPSWRKVEDPDGATGWMLVSLLSDTRTAIVRRGEPKLLRRTPSDGAEAAYGIEPGVVGRVSRCGGGWCRMEVQGRAGFIRTSEIWGVDAEEELD